MKRKIVPLLIALVPALWGFSQNEKQYASTDQARLKEILDRTGEYCEKLKGVVFHFVCHENIMEKVYLYDKKRTYKRVKGVSQPLTITELKPKKIKEKIYVYDYQLIKKGEEPVEKRILLEEDGKEKHQDKAELNLRRIQVKYLVYGPVGFLSRYWQDHFDYEIVGNETINGKDTFIISAVPNSFREDNYSFGKIWVDQEDYSILKIEWDQRSIKNFKKKVKSRAGDLIRTMSWGAVYGVEKKGIRFPSSQYIKEYLESISGKRFTKYDVSIVYNDYKFFTVKTEVKFR